MGKNKSVYFGHQKMLVRLYRGANRLLDRKFLIGEQQKWAKSRFVRAKKIPIPDVFHNR